MVSTDPIADMLTRIRNAIAVNKSEISLPHSKAKETIARILAEEGFLKSVTAEDLDGRKLLKVTINDQDTSATITEISRVSKPGRRIYVKATDIPVVKRGRGMVVMSTSHGIMTGVSARAKQLGGEVICKVY